MWSLLSGLPPRATKVGPIRGEATEAVIKRSYARPERGERIKIDAPSCKLS